MLRRCCVAGPSRGDQGALYGDAGGDGGACGARYGQTVAPVSWWDATVRGVLRTLVDCIEQGRASPIDVLSPESRTPWQRHRLRRHVCVILYLAWHQGVSGPGCSRLCCSCSPAARPAASSARLRPLPRGQPRHLRVRPHTPSHGRSMTRTRCRRSGPASMERRPCRSRTCHHRRRPTSAAATQSCGVRRCSRPISAISWRDRGPPTVVMAR